MSTLTFYRRVIEETGQADRAAVKRGTAAVLHALRDRLMPTEAAQAVAQLPRELKAVWRAGEIPNRTPVKISPGEADDVRAQLPRDLQHVWEDA